MACARSGSLSHGGESRRVAYFDAQEAEAPTPGLLPWFFMANAWLRQLNPGQKQSYPTSADRDAVVQQNVSSGNRRWRNIWEYRRQFVLSALCDTNRNESKVSGLRIYRNSFRRTLRELNIDYPYSPQNLSTARRVAKT